MIALWLHAVLCTAVIAVSAAVVSLRPPHSSSVIAVRTSAPSGAASPLDAFVSFSIEFSSFPDFAGNSTHPNTFSDNLLENIGKLAGTRPYIRVGGNTQDYAIFNASQGLASIGIVDPAKSPDYPTTLTIGPAFFESYNTWPDTKFVHGFNLGRNSSSARQALIDSIPYACNALRGKLICWELGNEPDLYRTSAQGPVRPASWDEQSYVDEWLYWTRVIRSMIQTACPDMASVTKYRYYAPSFAGTSNSLDPIRTWEAGLDTDEDIAVITTHNYISGATVPGVTLQGTLMNHTSTVASVAKQLNESSLLAGLSTSLNPNLPFIMGETNSLYNQGRPGLSNTFGAALWGIDFNLWCASTSIRRVHMHQGTNYRYQAWQPIDTTLEPKGTKAPYYGSIAVAAFLGSSPHARPQITNIPLPDERESAYAAYVDHRLARVIVVNMMGYNTTPDNTYRNTYPRPVERYTFQLPVTWAGTDVALQRLMANGSDAVTGVTFDGWSYNYELANGRPVVLQNVTRGEVVHVDAEGLVEVDVPRSSAVILNFKQEVHGA